MVKSNVMWDTMTVYKALSKLKGGIRNIMSHGSKSKSRISDYSSEDKLLPFLCWNQSELSQISRDGSGLTLASNLFSLDITFLLN